MFIFLCDQLRFNSETVETLTRSLEAVSNTAGPAYVMDEGTEHMAPKVISVVLTFLIDQPEATSDHLFHQRHPCPAQVVLVHHLYPHQLLEGELHVFVYLVGKNHRGAKSINTEVFRLDKTN